MRNAGHRLIATCALVGLGLPALIVLWTVVDLMQNQSFP
jgi:hypothetical protein